MRSYCLTAPLRILLWGQSSVRLNLPSAGEVCATMPLWALEFWPCVWGWACVIRTLADTGWVISMSLFLQDYFNVPSSNSVQSVSVPLLPESYLILGLRVSAASGWVTGKRVPPWSVPSLPGPSCSSPHSWSYPALCLGYLRNGQHREIPYYSKQSKTTLDSETQAVYWSSWYS